MNCIMYSILVNPTHAVTGALAPSSPFCGFIFSFFCDLIFFSFSLFLTPLWLCIGDRPVYLTDFAPLLPQISPWAHTPMFSAGLGPGPRAAILSPSPPRLPQDQAASTGFDQLGCAPRERPHGRPLFPPVEFLPRSGYGKQKQQVSCSGGVAGEREGLGICYPALASSLSLFSLSLSNTLNLGAACNALVFVRELIMAVKRKSATENHVQQ